jgi:hypothetical protein
LSLQFHETKDVIAILAAEGVPLQASTVRTDARIGTLPSSAVTRRSRLHSQEDIETYLQAVRASWSARTRNSRARRRARGVSR